MFGSSLHVSRHLVSQRGDQAIFQEVVFIGKGHKGKENQLMILETNTSWVYMWFTGYILLVVELNDKGKHQDLFGIYRL